MTSPYTDDNLILQITGEEHEPLLEPERRTDSPPTQGQDEVTPLNYGTEYDEVREEEVEVVLTSRQSWSLYLSHFLSTWNARGYEFAAIIFTASAYPETLTASSIRGIITTISTLALSSSVGRWCDRHPSRLQTLRITIFSQRICVIFACLGWIFIVRDDFIVGGFIPFIQKSSISSKRDQVRIPAEGWAKAAIMAGVMILGIGERLSAVGNMMVMERDWVPTLAGNTTKPSLPELNAVMRRIDLICKLISPVFISFIALWAANIQVTILIIVSMNLISMTIEWFAARNVWIECERLQAPKLISTGGGSGSGGVSQRWGQGLKVFFGSEIWIPSLSLALLYVSVLSFSASMITYLLNAGFTLSVITLARAGSTLIEVSSTIIMPWGVRTMEKAAIWRARRLDASTQLSPKEAAAVERTGLWGLWWMVLNLIPVTLVLFYLPTTSRIDGHPVPSLTISLFSFLALSRLGLWTYDLASQTLVQTRISAIHRGEFSGVEMGFMSAFELLQWIITAIWSVPEQFKFVAAAGNACVMVSALAYTAWMWRRRGHLLHWEKFGACTGCE